MAYNTETIIAEKLETVISRATFNTRLKDFYDLYIFDQKYYEIIDFYSFLVVILNVVF